MPKAKRVWTCTVCTATFDTALDHKVHAGTHIGQRGARLWPVSCWGCATRFDPNETLTCPHCGLERRTAAEMEACGA